MVDEEIFSRRLDALESYLVQAERLGEVGEDAFVAEPAIHDLAERYLHLAAEATIDLANHYIADRGLRTPESNRDAFTVLCEAGVLEESLAERLRAWAGFRNVLVHGYASIDHRVAWRAIQDDLGDLRAFKAWAVSELDSSA